LQFVILGSLSMFSQIGNGGFKLEDEETLPSLTEVLLSFDAIVVDQKVELTWSSDTEHNNNFFTIENLRMPYYLKRFQLLKVLEITVISWVILILIIIPTKEFLIIV